MNSSLPAPRPAPLPPGERAATTAIAVLAGVAAVIDLAIHSAKTGAVAIGDSGLAPPLAVLLLTLLFGASHLTAVSDTLRRRLLIATALVPLAYLGTGGWGRPFSTFVLSLTSFTLIASALASPPRRGLRRAARLTALLALTLCISAAVGRATSTYHLFTGATFSLGELGAVALAALNFALTLSIGLWTAVVDLLLGGPGQPAAPATTGHARKRRLALTGLAFAAIGLFALGLGY